MTTYLRLPSRVTGQWSVARTALAASYAAAVGLLSPISPTAAAAIAVGPIGVYFLARSPFVRLMFFVLGAILTLGVSSGVGTAKYVYAAGVGAAALLSAISLMKSQHDWRRYTRPLFFWALACTTVVVAGFLVSPTADAEAAVRLGTFYLLVLVAPFIGLDAGAHTSPRTLVRAALVIGSFSALAYAVDWAVRRGVAALAVDTFAASSLYLPTFALALALIIVLGDSPSRSRVWWPVLVLIPVALLFSGNRTAYLVPLAGLALIGRRGTGKITISRGAATALGVGGVLAFVVPILAEPVLRDPDFIARRIASVFAAQDGALTSDLSYQMRARQYELATSAISDSPLIGNGVHFGFGVSIDNFLATPARIGWLGAAAFVAFIATTYVAGRRLSGSRGSAFAWAYLGTLLVVLATAPLTSPVDDRGFAAMIAIAVAGMAASGREPEQATTESGNAAHSSTEQRLVGAP